MNAATRHAIEEAQSLRFLALAFERPKRGWLDELAALSEAIGDPRLAEIAAAAREAREGEYHALLGPGGPVSPREVAHRGLEDPGRLLADIALAYDAFAYSPKAEDPRDHLAVETDFVAYLWLKEAFALEAREDEALRVTREARERFAERHLGLLAHRFADRLGDDAPAYLVGALRALVARLPRPPAAPSARATLPVLPDEDDFACGIPDPENP